MAYNSNKIEGSTLTPEQTASLFDTGILPGTDDYYRAKDVEETNGHFFDVELYVRHIESGFVAEDDKTFSL